MATTAENTHNAPFLSEEIEVRHRKRWHKVKCTLEGNVLSFTLPKEDGTERPFEVNIYKAILLDNLSPDTNVHTHTSNSTLENCIKLKLHPGIVNMSSPDLHESGGSVESADVKLTKDRVVLNAANAEQKEKWVNTLQTAINEPFSEHARKEGKEEEDSSGEKSEDETDKETLNLIAQQAKDESRGTHHMNLKHFHIREGVKYCNHCKETVRGIGKQGLSCDVCKFILHSKCLKQLGENVPKTCKVPYSETDDTKLGHHWVEGNVTDHTCLVCKKNVGSGFAGLRCSWCEKSVHAGDCHKTVSAECDMGPFRRLILPPTAVKRTVDQEGKVRHVINPADKNLITPLIIFINKKSGGQQGTTLLRKFRRLVNPLQVFDLGEGGPAPGLEAFRHVPRAKVLVAGGDGTAGWVLMQIDKLKLEPAPPVAVLPLGTGNDLARALKWGGGYEGERLDGILNEVDKSREVILDRWSIHVSLKKGEEFSESKELFVMNNYYSIGVDAKVALEFHRQREAHPEKFNSRVGNKFTYGTIGGKALFDKSFNLWKEIELVTGSGETIALPHDAEGIIILNLDSYMGGANLWGKPKDAKYQSQNQGDGLLEIVAVNSSLHLGAIKAHLSSAKRLCQTNEVKLTLKSLLPAQVDGEPFEQEPAIVHIKHLNKARMLAKNVGGELSTSASQLVTGLKNMSA